MTKTLRLSASDPAGIATAAAILQRGGTVAFPTETVYGLGANALDAAAVSRIFAAKQRPSWDPLIVHIARSSQLPALIQPKAELQARLDAFAATFWPGPLTLLLPRSAAIPDEVTAGRDLVGVRIPAHPVAQALLEATALPLAAPSANTFGHTSPTTAEHVLADLEGHIDAVLDAGPTPIGVESTVLDPTRTPMVIYRPGAVTAEQIIAATSLPVYTFVPASDRGPESQEALPSPGVGIRHYAPKALLVLIEGTPQALSTAAQEAYASGAKAGILLPTDWQSIAGVLIEPWGKWHKPETLAAGLFAGLRALDSRGATVILCPLPPAGGLNDATRDRLAKAAKPK